MYVEALGYKCTLLLRALRELEAIAKGRVLRSTPYMRNAELEFGSIAAYLYAYLIRIRMRIPHAHTGYAYRRNGGIP